MDDSLGNGGHEMPDEADDKVVDWLKSLGLQFNPFDSKFLDAGADPWLPAYLVGHKAFTAIWGDWPSLVFAPAGGGKSSFRVRLTRACRVGQDGRIVFPIVYNVPGPAILEAWPPTLDRHLHFLCRATAAELLLELAYRPTRYLDLDADAKRSIANQLAANLPGSLDYFLAQMDEAGDLSPLVKAFDPTAARLINPPDPADIRQLCRRLRRSTITPPKMGPVPSYDDPSACLRQLIDLIKGPLGYEAIYPLIDGVDAHVEIVNDPQMATTLIRPLLEQTLAWADEQIYVKYFLPLPLKRFIADAFPALTSGVKPVTIDWVTHTLISIVQERLRVASEGLFNSLDAISSPGLRGAESALVEVAGNSPREVLALAGRMLVEHVRRPDSANKLEPADLEAACGWYVSHKPLLAS